MNLILKITYAFGLSIFAGSLSYAGVCEVHFDRTACPGQEKVAYIKCGGEKTCVKKKSASSKEDCEKLALTSCENSRLTETKSKVIKVKWDGKFLVDPNKADPSNAENFCAPTRPDFNKCG